MNHNAIKLIECPRDAMQGWLHPIPTQKKIDYINALLKVGFDTIDFGSFVSPKAIPQMADTKEVLSRLDMHNAQSKLLAIVANLRGAEEAVYYEQISYLGFPFSISETFQKRNTNASIDEALAMVNHINSLCTQKHKTLVIYISMAFGNPYGDIYNEEIVCHWVKQLLESGIKVISLADTVGMATAVQVGQLVTRVKDNSTDVEFGVHLHSSPHQSIAKVDAALNAGCVRFDGALKGFGGCPMAGNDLIGNMETERMIEHFSRLKLMNEIDREALQDSLQLASEIFI